MNIFSALVRCLPSLHRGAAITAAGMIVAIASMTGADGAAAQALRFSKAVTEHLATGFPLRGAHEVARCETCHARGIFKGTPKDCNSCHGPGARLSTYKMAPTHAPVVQPCSVCHNQVSFDRIKFDHTNAMPGTCATCHNGLQAAGKPTGHLATVAPCDTCHRSTNIWAGATFDHAQVRAGTCASCHNGTNATGKPANHLITSAQCDSCHMTTSFIAGVKGGMPAGHVPTKLACTVCHTGTGTAAATSSAAVAAASTIAPGVMNHTGISSGCATCHDAGKSFTGVTNLKTKPGNHVPTNGAACEACHAATNFTTFAGDAKALMKHSAVAMPCASCHEQGLSFVGSPAVVTRPMTATHPTSGECGTCHTSTASFATGIVAGMPAGHIPAAQACTQCHTNPASMKPGVMNHAGISSGCANCHDTGKSFSTVTNPKLVTKSASHVPTSAPCETCHLSTTTFKGAVAMPAGHIPTSQACTQCHTNPASLIPGVMSHAGVSNGCAACHDTGKSFSTVKNPPLVTKSGTHIPTSAPCETCHTSTTTFKGAVALPAGHIPTGQACTVCHTGTGAAALAAGATMAPATMSHAGITSGCATCHDAGKSFSTVKKPALVTKPGNHAPTTTACESCHTAGNFTTFSGNAKTLMVHSAVTGTACATCHEKGKSFVGTPSVVTRPTTATHPTTGECGTCHSSTVSFAAGVTTLPANHIPAGGIACTQCHASGIVTAGSGKMSHTGIATGCTACHAQTAAGTAFLGVTPMGMGANHIPTMAGCETCHKSTDKYGPGTVMNHAGISSGCATCHAAGKAFNGTPAVKTMATTPIHVPIGAASCESCHAASNFSTFAGSAKTLMNHSAVAGTTCATCHETGKSFIGTPSVVTRPLTTTHPKVGTGGDCGSCHGSTVSFATSITGGMPTGHLPTTQPCALCHTATGVTTLAAGTGMAPGVMNHTGISGSCATCHSTGTAGTAFVGVTPKPQGTGHIPNAADCVGCHKATATAVGGFVGAAMNHAGITTGCTNCHGTGKSFTTVKTPPLKTPPTTHVPFGTAACESCHAASNVTTFSGNAKTLMVHSAVTGTTCATCHEKGKSFVGTPMVVTRPTTATHPTTGECGTCHGSTVSFATSITGGMPANHIPTTQPCALCHTATGTTALAAGTGIAPGVMNHTGISGSCATCHSTGTAGIAFVGVTPKPQGTGHIPNAADCVGCHKATATAVGGFVGAAMNHAGITTGCTNCHGTGKSFTTVKTPPLKDAADDPRAVRYGRRARAAMQRAMSRPSGQRQDADGPQRGDRDDVRDLP